MEPFDWSPPPTPPAVTAELFASTPDDILENVLLNYVLETQQRFPDLVECLPVALQAHYVAFMVDAEVLNGGFNQLMFNSPQIAEVAAEAFRYLRMPVAADMADRAWKLYEKAVPSLKAARQSGTVESFMETYREQLFDELDHQYASAQAAFRGDRLRYIREQPSQFFHSRAG
jgi:Domain of unknown function (DUF4375)